MTSVTDSTQETQLDNHVRSPFHLKSAKVPIKLISLNATLHTSGHGASLSNTTSPTSSTSSIGTLETMSPKSLITENPFSFNVRKIEPLSLSARSSLVNPNFADSDKLIEYKKEIAKLKKEIEAKNEEIEAKEAKLTSSIKSIKQFWSPELKKERTLRKGEEAERNRIINEKVEHVHNQVEEYKTTVKGLEIELTTRQEQIKSLSEELKNQHAECEGYLNEIKELKVEVKSKEGTIASLNETIDDLNATYKLLEKDNLEKSDNVSDLEIILFENARKEEEFKTKEFTLQMKCQEYKEAIEDLESMQKEFELCKAELKTLQEKHRFTLKSLEEITTQLDTKDKSLDKYKNDNVQLEQQLLELQRTSAEEKKKSEDEIVECHNRTVEELEERLRCTERNFADKEEMYDIMKKDMEDLEKDAHELEEMYHEKDGECSRLQEEVLFLDKERNKLENDLNLTLNDLKECKSDYQDACSRLESLLKSLDELTDEREKQDECEKIKLQGERTELLKQISDSELREQSLREDKVHLEEKIRGLHTVQTETEDRIKTLQSKEKKLLEGLKETRANLEKATELSRKYETENKHLIQRNTDMEKENLELKVQLNAEMEEKSNLKSLSDDLHKAHSVAEESIKELHEQRRMSHSESEQMSEKLKHFEMCSANLEQELQEARRLGASSTELSESLELKTKELQDMTAKYDNLSKYLAEREVVVDTCREELAEVKEKNEEYQSVNRKLSVKLEEHKGLLDQSEKDKKKYDKLKNETVPAAMYEKLKKQVGIQEDSDQLKKLLDEKKLKLSELETMVSERDATISELRKMVNNDGNLDQSIIERMQEEKDEQTKEITFLKLKVSTMEKQRNNTGEEKTLIAKKNLWDDLSRKDARIEELEKQLKEKIRQLAAMKKTRNSEMGKQQLKMVETKKEEDDAGSQLNELKAEYENKVNRLQLLEEALREMVIVAKEREDILARYAEVYEEVDNKYEETEREYTRIAFERSITNIKNASLILMLSERDALLSSMKVSQRNYVEELFSLREERLMGCISEKDDKIAQLESQSPKANQKEIRQLREEKKQYVAQLKEHNNQRMVLVNDDDDRVHCLTKELLDARAEQVYEAIRHLSSTNAQLEDKIEELVTFLRDRSADLLKEIGEIPIRDPVPGTQLKVMSKEELMKELGIIEEHSFQLKAFVEDLVTLLEGD